MSQKKNVLPVIVGGSTTVDGPKNDGISPDVVTGVFKSPVCVSQQLWFSSPDDWVSPEWLNKLKCGWPPEFVVTVVVIVVWILLLFKKWWLLLLWFNDVAAVLNNVSKLKTLKWAAAADSVKRNVWCCWGATRVSNPSMIMAVAGGPGATPPVD